MPHTHWRSIPGVEQVSTKKTICKKQSKTQQETGRREMQIHEPNKPNKKDIKTNKTTNRAKNRATNQQIKQTKQQIKQHEPEEEFVTYP